MRQKRLACFHISGELMLEFLKDKTDLPDDAELVLVREKGALPVKDWAMKQVINCPFPEGTKNVIVFVATSKSRRFFRVVDDDFIPAIELKAK